MLIAEAAPSALANVECEAALLGALMIENKLIDRVCEIVDCEDFSEAIFGRVYSLIVRERSLGKAANVVTLHPYLVDDPDAEAMGGPGFLAKLTDSNTVLIGAMDFAKQVADLAKRRRLVADLTATIAEANDPSTPMPRLIDMADAALVEATAKGETMHQPSGADCIREMLEAMDEPNNGVECMSIPSIDRLWGKLRAKKLVVVAGRPGMGKSAFALSYAVGVAREGDGVLFVSREMGSEELGGRFAADMCFDGRGGVPYAAITKQDLSADQKRMVARAHGEMSGLPLQVIDTGHITIGRLAMMVRRWKRRMAARGVTLKLVIVDYMQLIAVDGKDRSEFDRVSEVSMGLKTISKDNDLTVMALSQLSRKVEERPDKRPVMSDLRSSGQIEQDADVIMFLYRAEYYLRKSEPAVGTPGRDAWERELDGCRNRIEFLVAKNRQGQDGNAVAEFWGQYQAVRG